MRDGGWSPAISLQERVAKALIRLDNAPSGLRPRADYVAVCSADNFELGAIASDLTSPYVTNEGVAGIVNFEAEFFDTNEREIAFRKWMTAERPDVTLVRERFAKVEDACEVYRRLLSENDDLDCVFVVWHVPALKVLSAIREGAKALPIVTVDLGNEIAAELRSGGMLKGIAAERPYDQGAAAASAALLGLIGRRTTSTIEGDPPEPPRILRGCLACARAAVVAPIRALGISDSSERGDQLSGGTSASSASRRSKNGGNPHRSSRRRTRAGCVRSDRRYSERVSLNGSCQMGPLGHEP